MFGENEARHLRDFVVFFHQCLAAGRSYFAVMIERREIPYDSNMEETKKRRDFCLWPLSSSK